MASDPRELLVAYSIDAVDDRAVLDWAIACLQEDAYEDAQPELVELAGLNPHNRYQLEGAGDLLERVVERLYPDFDVRSHEAVAIAKTVLAARCDQVVSGLAEPYALCRLVSPIEQVYDHPEWLGNLYNACDWQEPGIPAAFTPHVLEEAARVPHRSERSLRRHGRAHAVEPRTP